MQLSSRWSSDSESEGDIPDATVEAFEHEPLDPYSPISPATDRSRGELMNTELAVSPMQQHRAFSFCGSESSSMVGKTSEQRNLVSEMLARGQRKYTRKRIQKSTAKGKEREHSTDMGLDIEEAQIPLARTNVLQPDRKSKPQTGFDGSSEEGPKILRDSYFRWRDDDAVMVHDGSSNEPAPTEPSCDGTIDNSLPHLATARSNTADEHEYLPSGPPVASRLNSSMDTEGFKEATGNRNGTENQVDEGQLTDLEAPSTVTGPLENITTRPIARERSFRHQLTFFVLSVARSILGRIVHYLKLIVETQLTTPAIPRDHVRIRWTCVSLQLTRNYQ
jgi:hypothetical protein